MSTTPRRNRSRVDAQRPLGRIRDRDITVGRLLDLLWAPEAAEPSVASRQPSVR